MSARPCRRNGPRASRGRGYLRSSLVGAAVVLGALAGAQSATAGAPAPDARCAVPSGYEDMPTMPAAAAGFDAGELQRVVRDVASQGGGSVAVYRYGCKVAESSSDGDPMSSSTSWSAAKSLTSMAVGRAMQLGQLSLGDTVGSLVPQADRAHGALTVRQLLQQNTGLRSDDPVQGLIDGVGEALRLPFDHTPGSTFTYRNAPVALLGELVTRATGMDLLEFFRRELLAPLGIPAKELRWARDGAGRIIASGGVEMPIRFWARIGQLWLQQGVWNGRRLLDDGWMRGVRTSSPTNPCYGLLSNVDDLGCFGAWAPPDSFEIHGAGDQSVWIAPGEHLVVVRFGPIANVLGPLTEGVVGAIRLPQPVPRRSVGATFPWSETAHPPTPIGRPAPKVPADVGGPASDPSVPGPVRARAPQIGADELRAGRRGTVIVPIACPRVARRACVGTVRIAVDDEAPALANGRFALAPGTTGNVPLANRKLRSALGRRPRTFEVRATSGDDAEGARTTRPLRIRPTLPTARELRRARAQRAEARARRARAERRRAHAADRKSGHRRVSAPRNEDVPGGR